MIDFSSRQLRAFLLVAQHHNFTRAAEALFITPSGLSLLIREFENQLGFRLFDRTTRHVSLTTEGAELLVAARHGLEDLDAAMSRIGERAKVKACQSDFSNQNVFPVIRSPSNPRRVAVSTRSIKA
jgi:LysR family carnitine catabolism transcriptional activator